MHLEEERRSYVDKVEMVEADLSKQLIDAGAELIRRLDDRGIQPDAAFWFYFPDISAWKLVLAQAQVGKRGPKGIYRQIQRTLTAAKAELKPLELGHIALAKPDAPMVGLLRTVVRTGPGIGGIRFTHNVVNGTLIEDAYIYRLT
ncbi:MAG: hypothetical protein IIC01_11845 [Planctomycetes bacterium]|nr:hypothetical protein [Planctomycetota bacterium]